MADSPRPSLSAPSVPSLPVESLADLRALPKAELHVHLRGAAPRSYFRERLRRGPVRAMLERAPLGHVRWLGRHPGILRLMESDDPAGDLDGLFRYSDFEQFLAAYLFTGYLVRGLGDFRDLISSVREHLRVQGIVYCELTVSIPEYLRQGILLGEILDALAEDPSGQPVVRWIVDPVRTLGPVAATKLLERIAKRRPSTMVGMTLGGAEHLAPPEKFGTVYEVAREAGFRTTVHAGEALGAESVWHAVRTLRVERIGHGVRAAEDPRLVRHLAERGIPLEICPTSNVCTGVYPSLSEHPVRELFEAGVPMTINTDDPTFFGVSLAEELGGLSALGFSWEEIGALASGAFRFAFDPVHQVGARA